MDSERNKSKIIPLVLKFKNINNIKIYLQLWCLIIQNEAYKNGRKLEEQQLTKEDVPVIVEKCINFIYANGEI